MAEFSLPWAGVVTGDAGAYDDDTWSDFWKAIFAVDKFSKGVIPGLGNELAVTI